MHAIVLCCKEALVSLCTTLHACMFCFVSVSFCDLYCYLKLNSLAIAACACIISLANNYSLCVCI